MTYSPAFAVPSARRGLTSLFGMGRGGSPSLSSPDISFSCAHPPMRRCAWEKPCGRHCTKPTRSEHWESLPGKGFGLLVPLGCHRRRCCTCGLSTSSSSTALGGDLILGRASRLDAFSAYPGRTRLPCGAPGGTAGTPAVRPTRSSRTSVGAPQISNARNR